MANWALSMLLSHPAAFNWIGRSLFSVVGVLAVLGLRVDRIGARVERISARVSITPPDILAGLPWWVRMVVPETLSGWILLGSLALLGIWLARMGKWAKNLHS